MNNILLVNLTGYCYRLHIEDYIPGGALLFFNSEGYIPADHHPTQFFLGSFGDVHGADVPSFTQNRTPVCNSHDFIQFMRDKQNGLAFSGKIPHDFNQLINFLRSKNGGRFVKNQDFVIPIQHLENFHTLLHTDGNIFDQCIRIYPQTVFLA